MNCLIKPIRSIKFTLMKFCYLIDLVAVVGLRQTSDSIQGQQERQAWWLWTLWMHCLSHPFWRSWVSSLLVLTSRSLCQAPDLIGFPVHSATFMWSPESAVPTGRGLMVQPFPPVPSTTVIALIHAGHSICLSAVTSKPQLSVLSADPTLGSLDSFICSLPSVCNYSPDSMLGIAGSSYSSLLFGISLKSSLFWVYWLRSLPKLQSAGYCWFVNMYV